MADTKLQELILQGDLIARTNTAAPPYELWVTGRNSAGDGPASNKVTWTAPV